MDAHSPLLFFDSGIGGLSVLGPTRALLPDAPIVYAADNAGFPYGLKSEAELTARVPALLGRLVERYRPRLVVIACNTASVIALNHIRAALDLPVVGTVPAVKVAADMTRTGTIGVLGTLATVRQPYLDRLIADHAAKRTILRYGSPDLATMAERKFRGEPVKSADYSQVLAGLFDQPGGDRIDTIVLSSTHFAMVEEELRAAAPRHVDFVHGGPGIARRIAHLTKGKQWPASPPPGIAVFTGEAPDALIAALAEFGLTEIESLSAR